MINTDFCYLDDALGKPFRPDDYNGKQDKVGDMKYRDPDSASIRLYADLCDIWSQSPFEFKVCSGQYLNLEDQFGRRYSSDWIGPSRYWAMTVGMTDTEIGKYLKEARTIGGHVLWPVHPIPTLNTSRGGAGSLYDRIDLTLYEIQQYYLGKPSCFSSSFRKQIEKDCWFFDALKISENDTIENFISYIDFWKLNPFVDDDYQVISLPNSSFEEKKYKTVSSQESIFPGNTKGIKVSSKSTLSEEEKGILLPSFKQYVKNNVMAIHERNQKISEGQLVKI